VTPVPDVVLSFSFAIAPPSGGALRPSDLAGSASVVAAISNAYAQLLGVKPALVTVANFSDIATGAVIAATPVPHVRRLAGAAGSLGVSVSVVVALGKTPTEQQTINIQSALAATGAPAMLAAQASITQAAALSTSMPASYFAVGAPTAVNFIGSPFVMSSTIVVAAASSSAPAAGGAAAGGVVGAILLACALWSYRSYAKHGVLPCCRDRNREVFRKRQSDTESIEISNALADAERALAAGDITATSKSPAVAGGAGSSKALVVRRLLEKSARDAAAAAAEMAALKKELSEAKAPKAEAAARGAAKLGDGEIDYDELDKEELRSLAAERGIDVTGLKMRDMRKMLQAADEAGTGSRSAYAPQAAK